MNRTLILALALWTGSANFAYASAKIECSDRMQAEMQKEDDSCCASSAASCECSMQARSNDQSVPATPVVIVAKPLGGALPVVSEGVLSISVWFHSRASESPPGHPPLYQLFSVYRI